MTATATPAVGLPPTPFVGLTPFREADAGFFFGRERERRLLAASILSSRLTILYGASGVGKSSLLRAGLVPDFRARAVETVERGLVPESVLVVCSAWRDDPVQAVADATEAAVRAQLGSLAPDAPRPTARLDELLLEWTRRLDGRAGELSPDDDEPHRSELLLVLDQFEEYFLYHPDEDGEGTLAVELPRAVMREDLRASFLIAIREDAYTQLDRFEGRIRNLFASNFRLEHLDERAARRAIEGPVERYNELLAAGEEPYAVEPELVPAILDQVRAGSISLGQAGAGTIESDGRGELRVETPFLQLVLTRLWEEEQRAGSRTLRLATLERLGGAERLVRSHLDEALGQLPEQDRDLAASVFHQLVTPSGTKIVHAVPDLAEYARVRETELGPVLDALAAKRILRPVDPAPGATARRFEIFHDVLAPAILDWRAWHERRAAAARQRRARRRLAAVAVGLLAIAVVLAGLAVWALDQRREARRAADAAARQELIARSQALAASAISQIDADPELALLLGIEAAKAARTPEAANALRRALPAARLRAVLRTGTLPSFDTSADGTWLVGVLRSEAKDGPARLWRTDGDGEGARLGSSRLEYADVAFDRAGRVVVTAGRDGRARIFDVRDARRPRRVLRTGSRSLAAARFARDGRRVLAVGNDGAASVIDVRSGRRVAETRVRGPLLAVTLSPREEAVMLLGSRGDARVWRWQAGERPRPISAPPKVVDEARHVAVADDGRAALAPEPPQILVPGVGVESSTVPLHLVDPLSGARRVVPVPGRVADLAFSPRGRLLATAGPETGRVWDARTGEPVAVLRGHLASLTDISFSNDGATVLTGSEDGSARLWRAATGEPGTVLRGLPLGGMDAAFAGGGKIVTASYFGNTRVWAADDVPIRFARRLPDAYPDPPVGLIAFTPRGSGLLAGGEGGAWTLDAATGRIRHAFVPPSSPSRIFAVSPDGRLVAYELGVRETETGKWRWRARLSNAAFRRDSAALAFVDGRGRVGVWLASTGAARRLGRDPDAVAIGFRVSGAVVTGGDGRSREWSIAGGRPRRLAVDEGPYTAIAPRGPLSVIADDSGSLRVFRDDVQVDELSVGVTHAVAFSPDGRMLATAAYQGEGQSGAAKAAGAARVWDLAERAPLVLRGHVGDVYGLSFSPGGEFLATAGADGTVRVWQVDTGASVAVLRGPRRSMHAAEFSPDGRLIATGGADRVVRLYDCEPCRPLDELLELARSRVTRELTPQERRQFLG